MKKWLQGFFLLLLFIPALTFAQTCSKLGQNPGTAFPVCGVKSFSQSQVPLCGNRKVPGPCGDEDLTDKNPYWYKFTCYTAGTLGFIITPENLSDDYDWQLFDITGKKPEDIYTIKTLFVASNWSGEPGETGASSQGTRLDVCGGFGLPLFSAMPTLIEGHEYLLLISHFTDSQSGYSLEFTGGSADITDPTPPAMQSAVASCRGTDIQITLNKQLKCSSLAADGTDFFLPSGLANITSAISGQCNNGFETDDIMLTLDQTLPPGNYWLEVREGSDGNTLLDHCEQQMPPGSIMFTVHENVSAEFTQQVIEGCAADTVRLSHTGFGTPKSWTWHFQDVSGGMGPQTEKIYTSGGVKNIKLIVSNEHCTDTVSTTFTLPEKVNAAIEIPDIICAKDKMEPIDRSTGNIHSWNWEFGDGRTSSLQTPIPFQYPNPAGEKPYTVRLVVTDTKGCLDSASQAVLVVGNCNITVPSAFTPNNDGRNDHLYPSNAFNADNLIFRVFNRYGQMIYESKTWQNKWDGNLNGQPQAAGTYIWTLQYTLRTTGKNYSLKGTTVLIR